MPPEEADTLHQEAETHGPCLIYLLAPTSTTTRKIEVIRRTQGFIYYVSITGITGAKLQGVTDVEKNVRALQKKSKKPIAVGFGIATPEDAKHMASFADGVIVGSALVKKIAEYQEDPSLIQQVSTFIQQLKSAIRSNA